jgi:hypothetical protein
MSHDCASHRPAATPRSQAQPARSPATPPVAAGTAHFMLGATLVLGYSGLQIFGGHMSI